MKLTKTNLKKLILEVVKEAAEVFDLSVVRGEREAQRLEIMLRKTEDTLVDVMQPVQDAIDNLKSSKIVDYRIKSPGEIEALARIRDAVADYLLDKYPKENTLEIAKTKEEEYEEMVQQHYEEDERMARRGEYPPGEDDE
tara:strand:+ start:523 stop:942 length:420 start_codon:yes stop_codon:yes gene_type:complete